MVTINYEPVEHLPYIDNNISPEERANVEQLIRLELANQFNTNMTNFTNHRQNNTIETDSNIENDIIIPNNLENLTNLPLHPHIQQLFPNDRQQHPQPSSSLNVSLQHYQEEEEEEEEKEENENENESDDNMEEDEIVPPKPMNSIDLERYTNFENNDDAEESINYKNLYTTLGYSTLQQKHLELLLSNKSDLNNLQIDNLVNLDNVKKDIQININKKRTMIDDIELQRKKRQLNDFKTYQDYYDGKWKNGINSAIMASIEIAKNK
ncbi:unnamed protein product [Candida verbasci]|uniref:Uncharacterized protein n=1 Tax=Candida verbasci TaxID=1227364 RepID=A0A9W4X9U0_9ASCO|nr:unnamed protein product [Candida verbasci]